MLRGSIAGRPGSRVFLSLSQHGANGYVRTGGEQYIIAGAKPGAPSTVIYNLDRLPAGAMEHDPNAYLASQSEPEPVQMGMRAVAAG